MFSLEFQAESSQTKNISIKHNFEAKLAQNVAQFRSGRPPAAENSISGRFGAPKGIQKDNNHLSSSHPPTETSANFFRETHMPKWIHYLGGNLVRDLIDGKWFSKGFDWREGPGIHWNIV